MNENDTDEETIAVPRAQFLDHLIAIGMEGEWQWQVSDEVREKLDYTDVLRRSNVDHLDVDDERVEVGFTTESSVSELAARATHWQPAEYRNHDVTVFATLWMEWPEDEYDHPFPTVTVEQAEHPTEPPAPDVDAHRYDL